MTYGNCCFTCESQCPPHHVGIQPPPFCITIPGPIMSCARDSCAVSCDAPCCGGWGGYGGGWGGYGGGWGGYGGGWGGYGGGWGGYGGGCSGYGGGCCGGRGWGW